MNALTHAELAIIRELVYKYAGITLGEHKDIMMKNRMNKLARSLELTPKEVIAKALKGELIEAFINAYTTNKTDFFREVFHFNDLRDRVLPSFFESKEAPKIYSCASSTGEEPYSIAITCLMAQEKFNAQNARFDILATDIDTEVLQKAKLATYAHEQSLHVHNWVNYSKYFQTLDGAKGRFLRPKEEVLNMVKFGAQNLIDERYPFEDERFDVVFCRNVLIYFTQTDQKAILKKLFATLKIGGTLYLGHSESPLDLTAFVTKMGHNTFVKKAQYTSSNVGNR